MLDTCIFGRVPVTDDDDKVQGMAMWAGRGLAPRAMGVRRDTVQISVTESQDTQCEFQSPRVKTGSDGERELQARGARPQRCEGNPRRERGLYRAT